MQLANWLPWNWGKHEVAVHKESGDRVRALETDINRAFDDFRRALDDPFFAAAGNGGVRDSVPRMEVSETDEELEVSIELPGMSEEHIDVSLSDDVLTIRGERKDEREDKRKDYHLRELSYGSVQRSVALPPGLDLDRVRASFKNGVLKVALPKTEEARSRIKRIPVG